MSDALHQMPLAALAKQLAARELSAVELAQHFLGRIERHRGLNAFLDIRPEVTLAQAREADARRDETCRRADLSGVACGDCPVVKPHE